MNVENILKVADAIEQHSIPDLGFNMAKYFADAKDDRLKDHSGHECGTVACIAGHAAVLSDGNRSGEGVHSRGRKFLGLDSPSADHLFFAKGAKRSWRNITPSQAVAVLRRLAATGVVDWSIAAAETNPNT